MDYIQLNLKKEAPVCFEVYDLTGNSVMMYVQGKQAGGLHEEALDVSFLHPGMYVLTMTTDRSVKTMRLFVSR